MRDILDAPLLFASRLRLAVDAEMRTQVDVEAASPALERRQIMRGDRRKRVARIIGGRDEAAVLRALERQDAIAQEARSA